MKLSQLIDKDEVVRYLGCRGLSFSDLDDSLKLSIEEAVSSIDEIAVPRYVYKEFKSETCDDGVLLDKSVLLKGKDIARHLRNCTRCVLMAATLGHGVDREVSKLRLIDMGKSHILNAVAIDATEKLCDFVQDEIAGKIPNDGETITSRFSPGYGDMPLEQQKIFTNELDISLHIGVSLTDSLMLVPTKSVTAIIGIREGKREIKQHKCENCESRDTCSFHSCER